MSDSRLLVSLHTSQTIPAQTSCMYLELDRRVLLRASEGFIATLRFLTFAKLFRVFVGANRLRLSADKGAAREGWVCD